MSAPLTIALQQRFRECCACEQPVEDPRFGLPMYEGEVVPKDFAGEWGGFDCCTECHKAYELAGPEGVNVRLRALKEARDARETLRALRRMLQEFINGLPE